MRTAEQSRTPIGGVVGRWQVDDLHEAHRALLDEVFRHHAKVIAFVGTCDAIGSKKDPLDYPTRAAMLQAHYPSLIVLPLPDHPSDQVWSKNLDKSVRIVAPTGDAMLYGGRDSFIKHYHGQFRTVELDALQHPSGTDIRDQVGRSVRASPDFRAGVIYGQYNRYPRVSPVVDIAVFRETEKGKDVLLGSRTGEEGFRFPGGFVDPTDASLEAAARRELSEETGNEISVADLKFVGSFIIQDSRIGPGDAMMTTLFTATYQFGAAKSGKAGDDLQGIHWIPFSDLSKVKIVPSHEVLRQAVLGIPS